MTSQPAQPPLDATAAAVSAEALTARRKALSQSVPKCSCGEKRQIQLVNWLVIPARWRCRTCKRSWSYEPAQA